MYNNDKDAMRVLAWRPSILFLLHIPLPYEQADEGQRPSKPVKPYGQHFIYEHQDPPSSAGFTSLDAWSTHEAILMVAIPMKVATAPADIVLGMIPVK